MKKREFKRRKKKVPSQLVSFDEDLSGSRGESPQSPLGIHSAPSTCLNSPAFSSQATPYANSLIVLTSNTDHAREGAANTTAENENIVDEMLQENQNKSFGNSCEIMNCSKLLVDNSRNLEINCEKDLSLSCNTESFQPSTNYVSNLKIVSSTNHCGSLINDNASILGNIADKCSGSTSSNDLDDDKKCPTRSVSVSSRFEGSYGDVLEELMSGLTQVPELLSAAASSSTPHSSSLGSSAAAGGTQTNTQHKTQNVHDQSPQAKCHNFHNKTDYIASSTNSDGSLHFISDTKGQVPADAPGILTLKSSHKDSSVAVLTAVSGVGHHSPVEILRDSKNSTLSQMENVFQHSIADDVKALETSDSSLRSTSGSSSHSKAATLPRNTTSSSSSSSPVAIDRVSNIKLCSGVSDIVFATSSKSEASSDVELGSYKSSLSNLSVGSNLSW